VGYIVDMFMRGSRGGEGIDCDMIVIEGAGALRVELHCRQKDISMSRAALAVSGLDLDLDLDTVA
jgi:hypothetical protein